MKFIGIVLKSARLFLFVALAGCESEIEEMTQETNPGIQRILIIGNSITASRPLPDEDWLGHWGMAASDSSRDFVHILTDSILSHAPGTEILATGSGTLFENRFWDYDLVGNYGIYRDFKPDLVILRIGENVPTSLTEIFNFGIALQGFANFFQESPETLVICASGIWENRPVSDRIKNVCDRQGFVYLALDDIGKDPGNLAFEQYGRTPVGFHPNDRGMFLIAQRLWGAFKFLI